MEPPAAAMGAGRAAAATMATMACVCCTTGECALALAAALPSPAAFEALVNALNASGVGIASAGGVAVVSAAARGEATAVQRLLAKD